MLTVKHIEVTGHESLHAAMRVSYQPRLRPDGKVAGKDETGSGYSAPCVFIDNMKGDTIPLGHWGAFYVMNDAGKTVAKYDLGGWDLPEATSMTWTAGSAQPDSVRVTRVG